MRSIRNFLAARRAVAMIEMALVLPVFIPAGMYAIEMSNYSVVQMRVNQIALTLADNASRAGVDTNLATQQLRELDINDVLQGLRIQQGKLDVPGRGRVTISSLETNSSGGQWVHWQRCLGIRQGAGYDSSATEGNGATGNSFPGMGPTNARVTAPPNSAVMYVEINYDYRPLVAAFFVSSTRISATASFIVRDNRDLASGITNPAPAQPSMTCNKYTS